MRFRTCCRAFTLAVTLGTGFALAAPASAGSFAVSIRIGYEPPPLPVYDQPPPPAPEYIWTPGYWAWDPDEEDYYWVPGVWVMAPEPGLLWTPPWWGWEDGLYVFHHGYWAPHVGFYGGVAYGFGYTGMGYEGGYWRGPHFFYNRTVNNITNVRITNIYSKTVIVQRKYERISYNGGPRGIGLRPTDEQMRFARDRRLDPTGLQQEHMRQVRGDDQFHFSSNQGSPRIGAMSRPGMFRGDDRHDARPYDHHDARPSDSGDPRGANRGPDHTSFGPAAPQPYSDRPDHGRKADRTSTPAPVPSSAASSHFSPQGSAVPAPPPARVAPYAPAVRQEAPVVLPADRHGARHGDGAADRFAPPPPADAVRRGAPAADAARAVPPPVKSGPVKEPPPREKGGEKHEKHEKHGDRHEN